MQLTVFIGQFRANLCVEQHAGTKLCFWFVCLPRHVRSPAGCIRLVEHLEQVGVEPWPKINKNLPSHPAVKHCSCNLHRLTILHSRTLQTFPAYCISYSERQMQTTPGWALKTTRVESTDVDPSQQEQLAVLIQAVSWS